MSIKSFLSRLGEDPNLQSSIPFSISPDSILDKPARINQYISYMFDRTNAMFEWHNLPSTIPDYMLELYLQIFGYAAFCSVDSTNPILYPASKSITTPPGVYIFYGGIGGERDIYYRPRLFTAANPRLKESIQYPIMYPGDDPSDLPSNPAIIMPNDHNYAGLLPLFQSYAVQLTENDISIRSAQINARALTAIATRTDAEAESARKFFDDLEAGKLGYLSTPAFLSGIMSANISPNASNTIIQLIELQQYLKASWFNELGLNVNFNMKREYMSEEEIAVNTDILLPLVDDMLKCRQQYAELINSVFNLNISVEKSSAWANKEREETAALVEQENEAGIEQESPDGDYDEGGESNEAAVESEVQTDVQSTGAESGDAGEDSLSVDGTEPQGQDAEESVSESASESASESGSDAAQEDVEDVGGEPSAVVNVTINIDTAEEVSADVESSQLEAQEESKERDG